MSSQMETGLIGEHGQHAQNHVAMELNPIQEIVQIHQHLGEAKLASDLVKRHKSATLTYVLLVCNCFHTKLYQSLPLQI